MDADRWRRISRLYHEALERPADQRAAFLDAHCHSDETLRRAVASLLMNEASADSFFAGPAAHAVNAALIQDSENPSGGPRRIGRFEHAVPLGEGGMGLVYTAVDPALDRRVAIKIIRREFVENPTARQRFMREARLAASINDSRICQVYEIGEADGDLFIVMELLEGESLASRLSRGAVSLTQSVPIMIQILEALDLLHRRDIVHRDLKPSNIFLTPTGVKLLDFGLARHVPDAAAQTHTNLTVSGVIVGTPRYMAPEQLAGESVDQRTDLFAAGSIFHELLSGRPAFDGSGFVALMQRILNQEPPSLGGSTGIEAADEVIQRAWARLPGGRYASARAMADAVRSLLVYCDDNRRESAVEARAPIRSIAVLPFLPAAGSSEPDAFADGITEDVIAQLSKIRGLKVIARASVLPFRNREMTARDIAARLAVRTLLDGSIRQAGGRVRIVVHLIDAATEAQLWSDTYDRELADIFAIQSDVAKQIAGALEVELSGDERRRLGSRPTANLAAFQLYLKGRHCVLKYTAEGLRQGLAYLEQSISEDTDFALGHAWAAFAHVIATMGYAGGGVPPRESRSHAREAAQRALAIDTQLGDAHGAVALVKLVIDHDWSGCERAFRRGLELSPGSDFMWAAYGLLLSTLERFDEAIAAYRRAKELDPLTAVHASTLASVLLRAGRLDEALDEARRLTELAPEFPMARSNLGWAYLLKGANERGLAELEKAAALAPGNSMLLGQLGEAYALAGRTQEANDVLKRLRERQTSSYHLAYVYTGLGDDEAAMDCLERAYEEQAGGLYGIKGSFLFRRLVTHPRFIDLLRRMNLIDDPCAGEPTGGQSGREDAVR